MGILDGVRLFGRGVTVCVRNPYLIALGLVPAVVVVVFFTVALAALVLHLGDLAAGATWFAADWSGVPRTLVRVLAGIAILGVAALVGVLTFTAVVLAVGEPCYERISRRVEDLCGGGVTGVELGFCRSLRQGAADTARLIGLAAAAGGGLFLAGFLPGVGQTVVPALGVAVGGWFLAVELVGVPFARRGLRVRDRWRALRTHRATALGFGTAVFGCFLVPGGAVLLMPAAVAGGTLLARRVLGLPDVPRLPDGLPPRRVSS